MVKRGNVIMKNLIYLFSIVILSYSCSDSNGEDNIHGNNVFTVEINTSDNAPVLWQQVGFYIQHDSKSIKTVDWNFGDGSSGSGIAVEHSYKSNGTYKVSAKATNKDGNIAEHSISLTVSGRNLSKALKHFDQNRVWICAHRCNTGDNSIPENSISALKKCIELGSVDMVEIDTRMTKDGVIVLMHDKTVNRTTNGVGKVSDLTYTQIHALRLKSSDGTLTQDTVPTLQGFMKEAKDKIFIDLDYIGKVPTWELYSLVKECGMLDQVMFYTSNDNQAINSLLGYSPSGIIFTQTGKESDAVAYKTQGVHVTQITTAKMLETNLGSIAAQNSLAVFSNTLVQNGITIDNDIKCNNDYSGVNKMLRAGINIIQTDQAPLINTYLISKDKR